MAQQPDIALVPKHEIVKLSGQLCDFRYLNDFDGLAKLIEKYRPAEKSPSV